MGEQMIVLCEKKLEEYKELENCISIITGILSIAADETNDEIFIQLFPVYMQLKRDFENMLHITFIDCGVEFYAKGLNLMCNKSV